LLLQIDTLEGEMSSSDIILVSDGEIPNPPVSNVMMAKLESLRQQTGMEIHGLLVGKKESAALSSLCDSVHDFLVDYELINHLNLARLQSPKPPTSTALNARSLSRGSAFGRLSIVNMRRSKTQSRNNMPLYASRSAYELEQCHRLSRREGKSNRKTRFLEDDDDWDWGSSGDETGHGSGLVESSDSPRVQRDSESSSFVQRLEDVYDSIQKRASADLKGWSQDDLDSEIKSSALYSKRHVLSESIDFVKSGLVEREVQAILVGKYFRCSSLRSVFALTYDSVVIFSVLGMISEEHVLFIGPPGTSKSELGRRLSQLCGGPFFQRLFTRFTTPEEIFGPLRSVLCCCCCCCCCCYYYYYSCLFYAAGSYLHAFLTFAA
jgi:MoxR-like ATPase